jgi:hypothetical protein
MRVSRYWLSFVILVSMATPVPAPATVAFAAISGQERTPDPEQTAPVAIAAYFTIPHGGQFADLFITARLKPGYWLYSITQPSGGPHRTLIRLEDSSAFRLRGQFRAIQQPWREMTELPDWPVLEKHPGCVTWHACIEFLPGMDPHKLTIKGAIWGQVDTETFCLPPTDYSFVAAPRPARVCCETERPLKHRLSRCVCAVENRHLCGWLSRAAKHVRIRRPMLPDSGNCPCPSQ